MKQVIYGTVPSKSNCYKIVVIGRRASLAKTAALLKYDVYYPNQRADLDNSLKIVLDCLQRVKAIRNDNKCTGLIVRKFLDKLNPRIEFEIKTV